MIDKPKPQKYNGTFLTAEQLSKFVSVVSKQYDNLPLLLCATLGLRRGEALGIKWCDIDFYNNLLHIQRTVTPNKNGYDVSPCKTQESIRTLLVPQFVIDILIEYKKEQSAFITDHSLNSNNFVFVNSNGSLISANGLNKRFKKILKDNNLPNIRIHDLRHSWATLMLSSNMPLKVTSSMLGHSNASTTLDIYSHSLTSMQTPIIDHLTSLFDNNN